jgi:hypothetical protein
MNNINTFLNRVIEETKAVIEECKQDKLMHYDSLKMMKLNNELGKLEAYYRIKNELLNDVIERLSN